MKPLIIYLFIINAASFLLMLVDKHRARKKLWRIPEAILMGTALLGGSMGCLAGMHVAHHKTLKSVFFVGIPVILLLQLLALAVYFT